MKYRVVKEKEKKDSKLWQLGIFFVAVIMVSSSVGYLIGADGPTGFGTVIEPGSMVTGHAYIIFKDDSTYYARNGTTGGITFSDSNASALFQDVVDDLSIRGGRILCKGDLTFTYGVTVDENNVAIVGEGSGEVGYGTTFYKDFNGDLFTVGDSSSGAGGMTGRAWNVEFADLTIYDSGSHTGRAINVQKAAFIKFQDVFIKEIDNNAIYLLDTWGAQIYDSEISLCGSTSLLKAAVRVDGFVANTNQTTDVVIRGCAFEGNSYRDIEVFGYEIDFCSISDCYFEPSASDSNAAIWVAGGGVIISNNILMDGQGDAIVNGKSGYTGYPAKFVNNHIQGFGGEGIDTRYGGWAVVSGNYIRDCAGVGIYGGSRQSIVANSIILCGLTGIQSGNENTTICENIVNSNMQVGGTAGIYCTGKNAIISNNIVMDSQAVPTQTTGISVSNITCRISENDISGATTPISAVGALPVVFGNIGYKTENSGYVTVTGAVSYVTIYHGLVTTPTIVIVQGNNTGIGWTAVTSKTTTYFDLWFENQPGTSIWKFYWYAEV